MWWIALLGAAGVLLFLRKAMTTAEAGMVQVTKTRDDRVAAAIRGLDWNDPAALHTAADVAQEEGHHQSARALRAKAKDIGEVVEAVTATARELMASPLPGVPDKSWTDFVRKFEGADVSEISPSNHLGLFNVGFLRLRELGLAVDVRQVVKDGKPVWVGKLKPPMTVKQFLVSPGVQYQVFVKDMKDRADHIRAVYPKAVGSDIDGTKATLSGLLAAVKLAGTKGFGGWIVSPEQRQKFQQTTAAFKAGNGLF